MITSNRPHNFIDSRQAQRASGLNTGDEDMKSASLGPYTMMTTYPACAHYAAPSDRQADFESVLTRIIDQEQVPVGWEAGAVREIRSSLRELFAAMAAEMRMDARATLPPVEVERKVRERTIEAFFGAGGVLYSPNDTEDSLSSELEAFTAAEDLPPVEAADLLHHDLTPQQRFWVTDFMGRWEAWERRDQRERKATAAFVEAAQVSL